MAGVDPPHYIGDMFMGIFYTQKTLHKQTCTEELLHTGSFTHRSFYTEKSFRQTNLYTEEFLRTETFIDRSFYTSSLYTEEVLHAEAFTHRGV